MSLVVGENVGPYRVVEQLGQGGMATVFKAYHAGLDRYVAIKVLHPAFKEDPTFLARFQREARVVARLEHPNIVPVYDFAEHNGSPYLVMKFIEGETLKARLQRERLSLRETLRVFEAVAAGLDYAHKQGILHRDIKSSNIMLAADGGVFLADFGLARIAVAGESTLSLDSMIGTPHYMSPEQAKGVKDLDAGTDIYSLGVVLYELVVGRLPYSADTPFAIIHDHIYSPLPLPRSVNPNVPPAIERVLLKALAKERADRYPDVASMSKALREALAGVDSGVVALPGAVPVSPAAPTAPTTASPTAPPTVAAPRPAAEAPPTPAAAAAPAPSPKAQSGYKFQWWHAALGLGLIALLCLGAVGLALRNRPRAGAAGTAVSARTNAPSGNPTLVLVGNLTAPPPGPTALPGAKPTVVPSQTSAPPSPPPNTLPPAGGQPPWQPALDQAAADFAAKNNDQALADLEALIAANPNDPGAYLAAGDLALLNTAASHALENFYLPGVALNPQSREPVFAELRAHEALAFYVTAADPGAERFLLDTAPKTPDAHLAYQRWRLFNGDPETARAELEAMLRNNPGANGPQLVYGDYFLKGGHPVEATTRYEGAKHNPPGQPPVVAWIVLEADCRLRQLRDQRAQAQLSPTCVPLPELVKARPTP